MRLGLADSQLTGSLGQDLNGQAGHVQRELVCLETKVKTELQRPFVHLSVPLQNSREKAKDESFVQDQEMLHKKDAILMLY